MMFGIRLRRSPPSRLVQWASFPVLLTASVAGILLSCADQASALEGTAVVGEHKDAVAQAASSEDELLFNGSWKPCRRKIGQELKRFDQRLEDLMASVPWYRRLFIHPRLKELRRHPELPDRFTLEVDSTHIAMDVDSKDGKLHYHAMAPRSGEVVQVPDWDGDIMDASFTVTGRRMRQHFDVGRGEGSRTNVSTLDESGDVLRMEVTIVAQEHLERPFVYVFHYCRVKG